MIKKQYSLNMDDFVRKLDRVMARLGVPQDDYTYDYASSRDNRSCFVQMKYNGRVYRFDNSLKKSADTGRGITAISDLFGDIVYSLEGLARSVERGIFSLDMLLEGVPALPQWKPLEACFVAMGFDHIPRDTAEIEAQFKAQAKIAHPDMGGTCEAFNALMTAYKQSLDTFKENYMGGNTK